MVDIECLLNQLTMRFNVARAGSSSVFVVSMMIGTSGRN